MKILMVRGVPVQVSDEDFEWASQWKWRWRSGRPGQRYAMRGGGNVGSFYLHREIWARVGQMVPSGMQIDHKDRDRTNNQRGNLRVLTVSANSANRDAKGYYWNKHIKRWYASVKKDRVAHHFGCFKTEAEAAAAAVIGKRQLYPELYVGE